MTTQCDAQTGGITVFTIGFTKKSAQRFFETLRQAGVKRVVDVRLSNESQLAGFTKKTDLPYFLKAIAGIDYIHRPELAPTKEMLDGYKRRRLTWAEYEQQFHALLEQRRPEQSLAPAEMDRGCLLCGEPEANKCHRRLVAEYLRMKWGDVEIRHL
ncbi:MAG TPA: DUF488 domain-containing protein [Planctomycetota bacterium]|nr:DUF488 domain-containing protein [Planctomycetota bacterium]HRR79104.1 DUF488 domain-containing protein [Planctomycetota bacterium]HRT93163.1 DUF488 domain-containing protein [Planctomycetota bacterium]